MTLVPYSNIQSYSEVSAQVLTVWQEYMRILSWYQPCCVMFLLFLHYWVYKVETVEALGRGACSKVYLCVINEERVVLFGNGIRRDAHQVCPPIRLLWLLWAYFTLLCFNDCPVRGLMAFILISIIKINRRRNSRGWDRILGCKFSLMHCLTLLHHNSSGQCILHNNCSPTDTLSQVCLPSHLYPCFHPLIAVSPGSHH